MHKKEDVKQRNWIIGQAVIELYEADTPVTTDSLLHKMQAFLNREDMVKQERAIRCAIDTFTVAAPSSTNMLKG